MAEPVAQRGLGERGSLLAHGAEAQRPAGRLDRGVGVRVSGGTDGGGTHSDPAGARRHDVSRDGGHAHGGRPVAVLASVLRRAAARGQDDDAARDPRVRARWHADSLEEAFDKIAANGVPDEQAGLIDYAVHIRSLGDWREPTRRVVAALYQPRPDREARLLHRWDEATNRLEVMT